MKGLGMKPLEACCSLFRRSCFRSAITWIVCINAISGAFGSQLRATPSVVFYYAIENLATGEILRRGITTSSGIPASQLILAPKTDYREWLLNGENAYVGYVDFHTPPAGVAFTIPPIQLGIPATPDSDGDGLSDEAELIVGLDQYNPDSDDDGIPDGTAVKLGLGTLGGITGFVGGAAMTGATTDVCAFNDLVFTANGSAGVTVFNVFNGMRPVIIDQIDTGASANLVACNGPFVAIASDDTLYSVTLTNLSVIQVSSKISGASGPLSDPIEALAAMGEYAFAASVRGTVALVDLWTGTVIFQSTFNPGLSKLAVEADYLYVLSSGARLEIARIQRLTWTKVGEWQLSASIGFQGTSLLVGGGRAYIGTQSGFHIVDVSNPAAPTLVARAVPGQSTISQIVANGTGSVLGLSSVPSRTLLYQEGTPPNTTNLVTGFALPFPATLEGLTLYNGLAYITERASGLQVLSYLARDTQRQPPTVSLRAGILADPEGVPAGQPFWVAADVKDDVQVRNVEFYLDGAKVATDGNFPFEYRFNTPHTAVKSVLTLRAVALDTGGNATTSADIFVPVLPDLTPPDYIGVSPTNSATLDRVTTISITLNEPIDETGVSDGDVVVIGAGLDGTFDTADDRRMEGSVSIRNGHTGVVSWTTKIPLPADEYRVTVAPTFRDLAGNRVETEKSWRFTISPPVLAITEPPDNFVMNLFDDLLVNVPATETSSIVTVRFLVDGNESPSFRVAPAHYLVQSKIETGTHQLIIVGSDSLGRTTNSKAIKFRMVKESVSRELSLFNFGTVDRPEAISREVTLFNFGSVDQPEAISREVSVENRKPAALQNLDPIVHRSEGPASVATKEITP